MAYLLGNTTLPEPNSFARRVVETAETNTMFNGLTKKRVVNQKEQFVLRYVLLTQAEVQTILAEYELNAVRDFSVSDGELIINSTPVLVDIEERSYNAIDPTFREDLTLVLTEVS